MSKLISEIKRYFGEDERLIVFPVGDKVEVRAGRFLLFTVWTVPSPGRDLYVASVDGTEGQPELTLRQAMVSALHKQEEALLP